MSKKYLLLFLVVLFSLFSLAYTTENGKLNINFDNFPYATDNQNNLYVTASGTGDCSSVENSCTFRTAVAKCTDDVQDVIWMSPEDHDTDNGVDGTGTNITAKNVRIIGAGIIHQFSTRFFNGHATASIVITASGHRAAFENLRFTQENKTDKDVTYLNITGSRSMVYYCDMRSATGATSDIAVLYNNTSGYHYMEHVHFRSFKDAGIRTNDTHHLEINDVFFEANAIGMDFTHADDGPAKVVDALFKSCTSGIEIAAGVVSIAYNDPIFIDNTTNIGSSGDYDVLHLIGVQTTHSTMSTYPVNAGTSVDTGDGSYVQSAMTEIIPASTITTPFLVQRVNIQSATIGNIFKLEFFYGENSGSVTSLGIFEFQSDRRFGLLMIGIDASPFPSNSYIGVKLSSSTDGIDNAVITLSYQAIN